MTAEDNEPFSGGNVAEIWMREFVIREIVPLEVGAHIVKELLVGSHPLQRLGDGNFSGRMNTVGGLQALGGDLCRSFGKNSRQLNAATRRFSRPFGLAHQLCADACG